MHDYQRSRARWPLATTLLSLLVCLGVGTSAAQAAEHQNASNVDAFYGAYQEQVSIAVPPFRGIEPKLALSYNSAGGNGFPGVGWTLSGVSVIERASPGKGAPTYGASDIYLLDGQELVPCAAMGGTHCTKIQSYLRIKFDASANTWTVWQKDGIKTVYGAVYDAGGTFRWGIKSVSDTKNNTVNYNWWCEAASDCYLNTVTYNGVTVTLFREARPDPISFAHGNGLGKTNYRLRSVFVARSGSNIRAYKLGYTTGSSTGRSLLANVQQYGRNVTHDGAGLITGGTALPATTFSYQQSATGTFTLRPHHTTGELWGTSAGTYPSVSGDFNGDGKTDFLRIQGSWWREYTSNGNGTFTLRPHHTTGENWGTSAGSYPIVVGDFNGDGKTDFLRMSDTWFREYTSNGNGTFTLRPRHATGENWGTSAGTYPIVTGDFNGDGKTDFLRIQGYWWREYTSNGDGTFTLRPHHTTGENWGTSAGSYPIVTGDFNGDGKTDFLRIQGEWWREYTSKGNGTFILQPHHNTGELWGTSAGTYPIVTGDFNGDGRTDFLRIQGSWWREYTSKGNGTFTLQPHHNTGEIWGTSAGTYPIEIGDFNGDGKTDFLRTQGEWFREYTVAGSPPDVMTSMSNGAGATTTVAYTPSSTWSNTNNPPITQTVSSLTVNDGRGGTATTQFSYQGGLFDPIERRFMGFRYAKTTDPCISGESACPYQEAYYKQDYGSVSKPETIYQKDGSGKVLSYRSHVYTTNGATVPYTSLESQQWEYVYDAAGAYKRSVVTHAYDAYANVTLDYLYGDYDLSGDEKTIRYRYYPNTTTYVVGRHAAIDMFAGLGTGGSLLTQALLYYDGNTTWAAAPSAGKVTKTASWLSTTNSYVSKSVEYDAWGNVTAEIDEVGNRTSFTIDPTYHQYVTRITNPLGQAKNQTWDTVCSTVSSGTDENGQTTSMQHDNLCRLTRTDLPGGGYEIRTYVNLGNASTQYMQVQTPGADASGNLWSRTYLDGLGRTWRKESKGPAVGKEIRTDVTFDARGNTWKQTLPYFANESAKWVTTTFDALDRPLTVTYPDGNHETRAYGLGVITQTDEMGHQQRDVLNAYGQVVEHAERSGATWNATSYTYDLRGNLTQIADPVGNLWSISYDSLGRRTQVSDPDAGVWNYTYDAAGRELAHTDNKGQRTEFTYDALGRKETKTIGAGSASASTMTWQYDQAESGYYNAGKLTAMTDPSGTASYDYDKAGRLVRGTRTIGSKSFTFNKGYDAGGRLKWTTYPDGDSVGSAASPLGYDAAGRLATIPGIVNASSYNASGDLTQHTNANGTVTTRAVSATRGWLTSINTVKGATTIQNLTYARDAEGKVTSVNSPFANEGWNYGYDELHRLTSATSHTSSAQSQTFSYNAIGNMTYNSRLGSYSYPAAGLARPHAVASAGANGFSYDANGNMVSGPSRTIDWDADNRPTQVNATLYSYDAEGVRLTKTIGTTTTYYVGNDYEVTGSTATKYVSLAGTMVAKRVGTTTSWIHTDHQGSIQAVTNASGVEIQRLKHRAYGERLETSTTHTESRGYTGQRTDDTGLMYLHARYYDPALGRFISPDPTIPTARTVGLNRYAYAANDPISFTDIDGLGFFKKLFKGVKKLISGIGKAITKVVDTVSKVPVIGGLLRVATITALGPIYGITTGDWKGLARAYATAAIIVASVVLMPACPVAGAGLMSYVGYVAGSAAVGFGAGFGIAMVNGASTQQALKAGLTGAVISGGLATLNAFYNATVGMSPSEYSRTAGDTFGTNTPNGALAEGSSMATKMQNAIPGGKAISGVHDWFVGTLDYVTGPAIPGQQYYAGLQIAQGLEGIPLIGGGLGQVYNAVTMPIAAGVTWGAYAAPYAGAIVGSRTLANDYRRSARSVSSTGWLANASGQPFGLASAH
jgi:RHS repeat-associated protein